MNRLFLFTICVIWCSLTYSQGFIYTIKGEMYFTEAKNLERDMISIESSGYTKLIPKSEIVLIEYMEDGIDILQRDKLVLTEPKAYEGDAESAEKLYKKYIKKGFQKGKYGWKCPWLQNHSKSEAYPFVF